MASGSFLPLGFVYWANGQYVESFYQDVDIDDIFYIMPISTFPDADGAQEDSFYIVAQDRHSKEDLYFYIKANGLTLANIATGITDIDSSAKFTTYTSLLSIDYDTTAETTFGSALINDRKVAQRFYNATDDYTTIQVQKRASVANKIFVVDGDQSYAGGGIII